MARCPLPSGNAVQEFVTRPGARGAGEQGWAHVARFTAAVAPASKLRPGLAEVCHPADEVRPIANLGHRAQPRLAAWLTSEV